MRYTHTRRRKPRPGALIAGQDVVRRAGQRPNDDDAAQQQVYDYALHPGIRGVNRATLAAEISSKTGLTYCMPSPRDGPPPGRPDFDTTTSPGRRRTTGPSSPTASSLAGGASSLSLSGANSVSSSTVGGTGGNGGGSYVVVSPRRSTVDNRTAIAQYAVGTGLKNINVTSLQVGTSRSGLFPYAPVDRPPANGKPDFNLSTQPSKRDVSPSRSPASHLAVGGLLPSPSYEKSRSGLMLTEPSRASVGSGLLLPASASQPRQ